MPAAPDDGFTILAGTLLARALLLAFGALAALAGWGLLGDAIAALDPGLLVLLFVGVSRVAASTWSRDARRAFLVALSAMALGAILDAVTPSYDGGPAWRWASAVLSLVSVLGTFSGLALIARGSVASRLRPRAGLAAVVLLALATLVGAARLVLHPDALIWPLLAVLPAVVGHLLMAAPLRQLASAQRAEGGAARLSPEGAAGLHRWGMTELLRLIVFVIASGVALEARRGSVATAFGFLLLLAGAALSALGRRGLADFSEAALAAGVRTALALAMPIVALVLAASILPSLLEVLVAKRESALTRAGISALEVGLLTYVSLMAAVGAVYRAAKVMSLDGIRGFAALLRATMFGVLVAAVSWMIAMPNASWDTQRLLWPLAVLLLIVLGLTWISSVVLLLVASRALAAGAKIDDDPR